MPALRVCMQKSKSRASIVLHKMPSIPALEEGETMSFKVGDEVMYCGCHSDNRPIKVTIISRNPPPYDYLYGISSNYMSAAISGGLIVAVDYLKEKEEFKMELNEIKQENLIEAKKQFEAERKNAEIEFARQKLREAKDKIDEIDRKIKQLHEEQMPYLKMLEGI